MGDPISPEEWLALCGQHEECVKALVENRVTTNQAFDHVRLAVETALKAYIVWKCRPNDPVGFLVDNGLKIHNLRQLKDFAEIRLTPKDPHASSWHVVLQSASDHRYAHKPMPRKVVRSFAEAAFGPRGVVTWLRSQLTNRG